VFIVEKDRFGKKRHLQTPNRGEGETINVFTP